VVEEGVRLVAARSALMTESMCLRLIPTGRSHFSTAATRPAGSTSTVHLNQTKFKNEDKKITVFFNLLQKEVDNIGVPAWSSVFYVIWVELFEQALV
jgi:hypothetical protein